MRASLAEIAALFDLREFPCWRNSAVTGVTTDSRRDVAGRLFVALKGERFDGHNFVAAALAQGAVAAVVAEERWRNHPDAPNVSAERILPVADPLAALGGIAQWWRRRWGGLVVAVTGSAGKTTTKTLLAEAFAAIWGEEAVWATPGNWNNAIGLPLTLLGIEPHHRVAVVEVAMNQPGEIAALGRLAEPNVALVLNALRAHLAGLGSVEAIANEKGSLVTTLAVDGVAVLPCDAPYFTAWQRSAAPRRVVTFGRSEKAQVRLLSEKADPDALHFEVAGPRERVTATLPWIGPHFADLATAALAVLDALGLPWQPAVERWKGLSPVAGRLRRLTTASKAVLLDDTYNANPDAMRAAIDALLTLPQPRKVVVMGEMAELGPLSTQLHEEVGRYAKARGVNHFLTLGEGARGAAQAFGDGGASYEQLEALLADLRPLLDEQTAVLVKGSRISRMERVVTALVPQGE
ncbi:hypothetical protein JCM16106_01760 [Hydrogenophilus islandicus]